jgi:[ribosomal protein S18]-alanine N-acetyltransferase
LIVMQIKNLNSDLCSVQFIKIDTTLEFRHWPFSKKLTSEFFIMSDDFFGEFNKNFTAALWHEFFGAVELYEFDHENQDFLEIIVNPEFCKEFVFLQHGVLIFSNKDFEIIGATECWITPESADLIYVQVKEKFWGKGHAKLLLKESLKKLEILQIENWILEVSEHNFSARKLYEWLGFVEISKRKDYYGRGDSAVVMSLKLKGGK